MKAGRFLPRHWLSRACGGLFVLLAGVLSAPGADPAVSIPIPESRHAYTGAERQRIRYLNSALLRQAHERIAREDYSGARQALREVLVNDPGNNHARVMLIHVHNELNEFEQARELAGELLAHYPDYSDLYLERAFIEMREGEWAAALGDLERFTAAAPADHPRMEDARQNKAEVLFRARRFEEAAEEMRALVALNDTRPRRVFLAECALQQQEWEEAVHELEAALRLDASDEQRAALKDKVGYAYYNLEEYEAAVTAFREALSLTASDSLRAELNLKLGYAYFHLDAYAEADDALAQAESYYRAPPELPEILYQRGVTAYRAGRYADAATFYERRLAFGFEEEVVFALLDALQETGLLVELIRTARTYETHEAASDHFRLTMIERRMNGHIVREEYAKAHAAAFALYEAIDDPAFLRTAATTAERAGRFNESIAHYQAYLEEEFDPEVAIDLHYVLRKEADRRRADGEDDAAIRAVMDRSIPQLKRVSAMDDAPLSIRRTAQYERAQLHRERDEMEAYFALMKEIVDDMPEGRFLYEYAVHLYGIGRYEEAVPLFEQAVELLEEPEFLRVSCKALADIYLLWNRPDDAIHWLDRAVSYGEPDRGWHLARARADYQLERFDHTIDRLLPLAGDDDIFNLYIGFSFYNRSPSMPGLSLAYMNRIQHPEKLTVEEQFNFYANRAYLNYDQYIEAQALADVERALAIRHDRDLELVRLRALVRFGGHLEVLARGEALIAEPDQDPAFLAPVYEMMGLAANQLERWPDAIEYFTEAVALKPELLEARYQRGLAHLRQDEEEEAEEDLRALEPHARIFPSTFWGDLGFILGHLRDYEAGTEWLSRSLARYPYDIDGWQERGYQSMKDHRNPDAKESFEEAIGLYDEIIPYVEEEAEAEDYRETRMSLKQEYTKLDKVWSLQVYGQRTDFDFDERQLPAGAPGDSTQGALQSQGGVSVGFRPPKVGFRNERTLDISLRVLANFEPGSWSPDEDSYQGGLGLMYKPFVRHNYVFGFERLFKIGDNAEDNWLWRNTYGIEAGERPERGQDFWIYRRFYGEASYYFETPSRWVFFGQGNIGPSFRLSENLLLTVPEALLVGRYQDNDPEGIGTYWYYGPGLNIRLLEGERALTRDRWALTGYAHYVWGRFDQSPENIDKNDFEGWIIGVNFTR